MILTDADTGREGITLAAILLFGKDSTIMSVLPQHKTDAIYRVENIDRYDDRDVIITNLFDTYDRLFAFARKHLNDPFFLDGDKAFSARDAILREIFSNILAHRDYSTGYVAKFVIEKDRMYTENGNLANGNGVLNFSQFEPFSKNPPIAKVFREVSLADELGSGMRNTYKYTKLYSGGEPQFIEGDLFRTIIPLKPIATAKVGPASTQDTTQDTVQDTTQDREQMLLDYCAVPRSREEIQRHIGIANREYFRQSILKPLLDSGKLKRTIPDKPSSKNQKYIKA